MLKMDSLYKSEQLGQRAKELNFVNWIYEN